MDIVERARTIALGTDSPWPLIIEMADEIERLRAKLLQIKQQSMETHTRATSHQALHPNEARILATNTYEAEGRN